MRNENACPKLVHGDEASLRWVGLIPLQLIGVSHEVGVEVRPCQAALSGDHAANGSVVVRRPSEVRKRGVWDRRDDGLPSVSLNDVDHIAHQFFKVSHREAGIIGVIRAEGDSYNVGLRVVPENVVDHAEGEVGTKAANPPVGRSVFGAKAVLRLDSFSGDGIPEEENRLLVCSATPAASGDYGSDSDGGDHSHMNLRQSVYHKCFRKF